MAKHPLQRARERALVSKAELARWASVSTLTIDRIEAGRPCRLDTQRRLLVALGLPLEKREMIFATDSLAADK